MILMIMAVNDGEISVLLMIRTVELREVIKVCAIILILTNTYNNNCGYKNKI